MLSGQYKPKPRLTVPLVTNLHPAITCLSSMVPDSFSTALKSDPLLNIIIPPSSLIVSYRKLPNLSRILCSPDQNKYLINPPQHPATGYLDTGCRCQVCKASTLASLQHLPPCQATEFQYPLPPLVHLDLHWSITWYADQADLSAGEHIMWVWLHPQLLTRR